MVRCLRIRSSGVFLSFISSWKQRGDSQKRPWIKISGAFFHSLSLSGSKNLVTGITKSRDDIAMLIQMIVYTGGVNLDIGMCLLHPLNAFGSGHQHNEDRKSVV